ncbi:glycosyl hydrolase family 65 protein, partial [Nonomuraea sp. NPDC049400]|uniref:glycosyl hydrolase family 65 protein n=1 Tax=Nonomuraea sp. NPDC049400 TaxID=3364352 RepID=UPI0037A5E57F
MASAPCRWSTPRITCSAWCPRRTCSARRSSASVTAPRATKHRCARGCATACRLDPLLPGRLGVLSMPICYHGRQIFIDADHNEARV